MQSSKRSNIIDLLLENAGIGDIVKKGNIIVERALRRNWFDSHVLNMGITQPQASLVFVAALFCQQKIYDEIPKDAALTGVDVSLMLHEISYFRSYLFDLRNTLSQECSHEASIKITFGLLCCKKTYYRDGDSVYVINLYPFLNSLSLFRRVLIHVFVYLLNNLNPGKSKSLFITYEIYSLALASNTPYMKDYSLYTKYIKAKDIVKLYFVQHSSQYNIVKNTTRLPSVLKINDHPIKAVRFGIVELWALRNWIRDRPGSLQAAEIASSFLFHKSEIMGVKEPAWPRENPVNNVLRLSTNAGFYATPEKAASAFDDWAERYYNALIDGCIINCEKVMSLFHEIISHDEHRFSLIYARMPAPKDFYRSLNGKSVLFLTAYFDELRESYNDGRMFKLYSDVSGIEFRFRSIPAPMSVHPSRPHESWSETYEKIVIQIDDLIRNDPPDIFIASAGCYGLPIVDHVFNVWGISSYYFGHMGNVCFGVLSRPLLNSHEETLLVENWIRSSLGEKYPQLSRVDAGRYT